MAEKGKKGARGEVRETTSAVILGMGTIIPGKDGPRFVSSYPGLGSPFGPDLQPEFPNDPFFGDFARAACPFVIPGYPQDHELAIKTGYRMKEDGNRFFHHGKYDLACTNYRYAAQLFQYVVKMFPYVATDILVLHSNLSVSHYKLKEYQKAFEHANTCIDLDHHFIKGYFRRAEAGHALAEQTKAQGQDAHNLFYDALRDYCKCYRKMTGEKDKTTRHRQFVDAMVIALEISATKFLPEFHESDCDNICGHIVFLLVSNYTSDKIEKGLNFLFFPNPSVEKSGLAARYHCDVSSLSVSLVFTKRVLTEPILDMLIQCNILVSPSDLASIVEDMKPKRDFPLFERLISVCRAQSSDTCNLSEVLDKALIAKNNPFAVHLLTVENVTPTLGSSSVAFNLLQNRPIPLFRKISSLAPPEVRADFAAKAVAASNVVYFDMALASGELKSSRVDLSLIVSVGLLNKDRRFLTAFLTTGASPDGVVGSPAPLTAVFRGSSLTHEAQVHVVIVLIEAGASIKHLSSAFTDPMSPLHVATKLVLETGIMKVLELVSGKFEFPTNGRIVDKHNRTPLHLVMLSEPSLRSIQILEHLVSLNIDKSIKDDQGKRAEDYALAHQDKKRKALVAVNSSTSGSKTNTTNTSTGTGKDSESDPLSKLTDRVFRNTLRREMLREVAEIEALGDREDEEALKKLESKYERAPKLLKMAMAKKGSPWACDMSLFPLDTSYEEALAAARSQKEDGNILFGEKKYSEALTTYGQSHMKFDWICANYPHKIPLIKDDIKILSCNMALGYHRSEVPEASVECCNDAIDIDPTYFKAYYRRAEAFKYIAQHRNHPKKPNYSHECLCNAVKDYARAYTYSTGSGEVNKRSEWYFECLIISIEVGHTENLPSIHDSDKQLLLTKVIEHLTRHDMSYYTKELHVYLDFILLKSSRLPNSGLAHSYPCSCASVSVVSLLPNVQCDLLKALLSRGCVVLSDDIVESIRVLKKSQLPIMKQLLDSFTKDLDVKDTSTLTAICNEIMNTKKLHFISLLVKSGATPNPESILEYADFSKLDSILTKYVAASCSPASRTKLFCCILQTGTTKDAVEVTLHSGPLLIEDINLSTIITSSLLVHHTEILNDLYAITPLSSLPLSSASPALNIIFTSKFPSRLQQVQLAESLIKFGADINLLSNAYSESLGPLHVATKLALETGHVELIPVVCSRFVFDGQSKLIDKNTQTPLHYVLRAKHNDKTIKICEYLCDYPIDPLIKDRWGKTAQDYGRSKGDKRLPFLQKVGLLTGHKVHVGANNIETPSTPVAMETIPDMPTTCTTSSKDESLPPSVDVHKSEVQQSKNNKKKKKKGGKGGGGGEKGGSSTANSISSQDQNEREESSTSDIRGSIESELDKLSNKKTPLNVKKPSPSVTTSLTSSRPPVTCPNLHILLSQLEHKDSQYFKLPSDHHHNNSTTLITSSGSASINKTPVHTKHTLTLNTSPKSISSQCDFDDQPWEVECTDTFLSFLKDSHYTEQIKRHILYKLHMIATGGWSKGDNLSRVLTSESDGYGLYEAVLSDKSSLIWEIAIQFSPRCSHKELSLTSERSNVYSDVIRIWDIVYAGKDKKECIEKILKSHERGLQSHFRLPLIPLADKSGCGSSKMLLPCRYTLRSSDDPCHNDDHTYFPVACTKDGKFNIIAFYSLTTSLVECALIGAHPRGDFPFKEWPKEHDIIYMPRNSEAILLLGRSGTGKTTCCLYRLWNLFNEYWEERIASGRHCYPTRPLPLLGLSQVELKDLIVAEDLTSVEGGGGGGDSIEREECTLKEDRLDDLHQVFLTKNYVLCSKMKKRFYDLLASHDCYLDHMIHENDPLPVTMTTIDSHAFPLFLTLRQFLILLDASLEGETFFPRNKDRSLAVKISSSDYEYEDPNTLLLDELDISDDENHNPDDDQNDHTHLGIAKQQIWQEVTSHYFVSEIWPKISHHCNDKSIDPLLVWIEIKSFIKGSLLAVGKPSGALTPWEYEAIGRKMATNFSGNRSEIYSLYEHYKNYIQQKQNLNLFDENDLVSNLYRRLTSCHGNADLPWFIHHFFINEVQDFTQAELALLLRLSREPNGLFLTGDTAQSIMKGISFRFRDLRSLFHLANTQSIKSSQRPLKIPMPCLQELVVNFRAHSGILNLATSVIELMQEYFPSSFDCLPKDQGMFPGPLPVFLQSCQVSDLVSLLGTNRRASSCIEFGAHQVIIVQNEDSKRSLPEVLKTGIVLTIFEAKGLEFDDVLLYNFFTDSPVSKEWRVVTTFADKITSPLDERPKPRPLNFNERFHKSLDPEFKYLYTAITRAKCNLWIYDSSEAKRLPMLDYWSRRGLIKMVRVGEQECDSNNDSVLFTSASTSEQWSQQGQYFLKKGLWEPAVKCFRKAGNTCSEKEAEGYLCVQKTKKSGQTQREVQELLERAGHSFLSCDYLQHNVKHINIAAKCLKNAGKYKEAAKLFESLGQIESAIKCYYRAKDYHSLSRLRETEGWYSEAVRIFVRANKRIEALEAAKRYETQGFHLEPDASSLQLANTYAKHYISHHEEGPLIKVLEYIPNAVQRVSLLKKGKLFKLAVDEHIKAGHYKDAERLMLAQEMFDEGIVFAQEYNTRGLESRLILCKVAAAIHNKGVIDETLNESLQALTKSTTTPFAQAKALLFTGIMHSKPNLFREAIKLYTDTCVSTIGVLESFNQYVIFKKKEVPYSLVIPKCFEAQELAKVFRPSTGNTPSRAKAIQHMLEFYKMNKFENVYLLSRSQDVWVKNLRVALQETDENGMLVLDMTKVHALLVERYNNFWSSWLTEADIEGQLTSRLSSYSFHREVSELGYLSSHLGGVSPNIIKEYIQVMETAFKTQQLNPGKVFRSLNIETLPLKLFSFPVSLCLPLTKMNCFQFRRSETVRPVLFKTMDSFLTSRSLRQPNVDDLFKAWFCQALIDGDRPNYLEESVEAFAKREGYPTGHTKAWLVMDKHNKDSVVHHHFFAFWLKACRLIREGSQVIVATKLAYNCFFCVIARRPTLRKTVSIINFVTPLSIFALCLLGVISVCRPTLGVCIPVFYRYQSQLFDILNIKGTKQFWMLSACVQLAEQKQDDIETFEDSKELLYQMLELLLGVYQEQYNPLKITLSSNHVNSDASILHCLTCVLTLLGNLMILNPEKQSELYQLLLQVESLIKETSEDNNNSKSYINTVLDMLQSANNVGDIFSIVQYLYQCSNYPSGLAKLYAAKTGNMDFKELSHPPQQMNNILIKPKVLTTSTVTTPLAPPIVTPTAPTSAMPTALPIAAPITTPTVKEDPTEDPLDHTPSSSSSTTSLTSAEIAPSIQDQPTPVTPVVDTQLQQQWAFTVQKIDELRQYHNVIEQQLIQLKQIPRQNMTQAHEQQQHFLTQQYYQIIQAQQQYRLQQENIQRQYQMSLLNAQMPQPNTIATNGAAPINTLQGATNIPNKSPLTNHSQEEDDLGMSFDEEEIEKILGSFMSNEAPPSSSLSSTGEQPIATKRQEHVHEQDIADQLVDECYCQVCGVTFEQHNTILEELQEEEGKREEEGMGGLSLSPFLPEYKRHVSTQTHVENFLAYKKFTNIKSGPFAVLRGKLNEVLRKGQEYSTIAQVDALLLQVVSELRELDEQLEELTNLFNWKEAHSRIMTSLDMLQAYTTRLVRTYESINSLPPPSLPLPLPHHQERLSWERDDGVALEDIEVAAKEFKKSKKRQKKKGLISC